VQLSEGASDTRRRVTKEALLHLGGHDQVERLIAILASKRLLATSGQGPESPTENFVEVSHEALIREWPALREWITNNREDLRIGRSILQAAEEWHRLKRDPSALMHGLRLTQTREWISKHPDDPPFLVREFLDAGCRAEEEASASAALAHQLRESERLYRNLFEYALIAYEEIDLDGSIRRYNPGGLCASPM
jgi:PAS domain-containing protein